VVVTRGRTLDNAANLAPQFLEAITRKYGGTRLGRQELDGELLEDVPGALWQRAWIDQDRVEKAPDLKRIVVAIDPSVSNSENADECGIIAAGIDFSNEIFVLEDATAKLGPLDWAKRAVGLYHRHSADRIVAEINNGGDLVRQTILTLDPTVPFKAVHASRGKAVRAEPVSSLYEQRKVHHVGTFPALEDQMCAFTSDFDRSRAGYSPDRVDALVWAITELAVKREAPVASMGTYHTGGRGFIDRLSPAEAVRLAYCSEERARRQGWLK
jgi:phage terminase large subunit-like protein